MTCRKPLMPRFVQVSKDVWLHISIYWSNVQWIMLTSPTNIHLYGVCPVSIKWRCARRGAWDQRVSPRKIPFPALHLCGGMPQEMVNFSALDYVICLCLLIWRDTWLRLLDLCVHNPQQTWSAEPCLIVECWTCSQNFTWQAKLITLCYIEKVYSTEWNILQILRTLLVYPPLFFLIWSEIITQQVQNNTWN